MSRKFNLIKKIYSQKPQKIYNFNTKFVFEVRNRDYAIYDIFKAYARSKNDIVNYNLNLVF